MMGKRKTQDNNSNASIGDEDVRTSLQQVMSTNRKRKKNSTCTDTSTGDCHTTPAEKLNASKIADGSKGRI